MSIILKVKSVYFMSRESRRTQEFTLLHCKLSERKAAIFLFLLRPPPLSLNGKDDLIIRNLSILGAIVREKSLFSIWIYFMFCVFFVGSFL